MGPSSSSSPAGAESEADALAADLAGIDLSRIEKFARRRGDALFGHVESRQAELDGGGDDGSGGAARFGRFLDAGTGSHSLRWMASVLHRDALLAGVKSSAEGGGEEEAAPRATMESFAAVTADEAMRKRVVEEARSLGVAHRGEVVIGNWDTSVVFDDKGDVERLDPGALLAGRTFDTILADYLVGAVDGFSPHFQDRILGRIAHHLAPGGRMYIIGLQPIPDKVDGPSNVFCKITKVRDACILLAGQRCYREYPLDWIERNVRRSGLELVGSKTYPIRYDRTTMVRQIDVSRSKLKLFPSKGLAKEMGRTLDDLEQEVERVTQSAPGGRITLGFDYVVVAERPRQGE
ncbi:hypothetical protein ACHAWF_004286 [Thalassiosira exigua]